MCVGAVRDGEDKREQDEDELEPAFMGSDGDLVLRVDGDEAGDDGWERRGGKLLIK